VTPREIANLVSVCAHYRGGKEVRVVCDACEGIVANAIAAAVAEERERCARICDEGVKRYEHNGLLEPPMAYHCNDIASVLSDCADAIRARSTEGGDR
jgi:hypothetical protein